jgi:hypothetical protein
MRKEVRNPLALLVVDPVLHTARSCSPELRRYPSRTAASCAVSAAFQPLASPQMGSLFRALHLGVFRAPNRAWEPYIGFRR